MSAAEQATTGAVDQPGPSSASKTSAQPRPPTSRPPTSQTISLLDRTSSYDPSLPSTARTEADESETPPSPGDGLNRKWTKQSLQQSIAHRRYARYQEDKLFAPERQEGDSGSEYDQTRMQWGKKKVKGLLKAKRQFQLAKQEDAAIDVLWENQRGWWAFGVPHFSSNSLLNFDPKPWLNGHRKPSPVNITNAQVPDPNWAWEWKSWYVDMSRDVDEEGWEYSFMFSRGFAWHGNHPWGHSWVRRRRWLRKRVRKHTQSIEGRVAGQRNMTEAHHLNADYFTIHPSNNLSRTNSLVPSSIMAKMRSQKEEVYTEDPAEVRDIGTLLMLLKRAALDREKVVLVRTFVENAGEDVYYLEEQMPTIMSLCIYQNSRRQLLSMLMEKCDAASRHRESHEQRGEKEGPLEKRRIDNLMRAINAADAEVKKLEYWSDQRRLVSEGKAGKAPADGEGWDDDWQGLDNSGPGSNARTTAKEKGKSIEEVVHEESHEQISPQDDADGEESDDTDKTPTGVRDSEKSQSEHRAQSESEGDTSREETEILSEDEGILSPPLNTINPENGRTLQPTGSHDETHESSLDAKYETAQEDQKLLDAEAKLDQQKEGFGASHATAEEDPRLVETAKEVAEDNGEGNGTTH